MQNEQDRSTQVLTALLVPAFALVAIAGFISEPEWLKLTLLILATVVICVLGFGLLRIIRRRRANQD
ncbi:hypothetical protein [Crossiella sp. CA198]|uniref:hypothetical protein n=1 Tax=Crossiella sp. CA198 TaxID=3455607 RepID=UPI003F8D7FD3